MEDRHYYGMVSRVDAQLGRVITAVERAGMAERTAVAFFTDHGDYLAISGSSKSGRRASTTACCTIR
jgi:arylsulfatase A-like enzyme